MAVGFQVRSLPIVVGNPFSFDLDCARPEVLCPSEAWPTTVTAEQRDAAFEHRMIVTLPTQRCSGQMVSPEPGTCGDGTCMLLMEGGSTLEGVSTPRLFELYRAGKKRAQPASKSASK